MTTVGDIILTAGRKIGVNNMTQTEVADCFTTLNLMLSQWAAMPTVKNAVTRESFSVVNGTATYTVGSGGVIDTVWPVEIRSAFIRENDNDHPLYPISGKEYAYTGEKSYSSRPQALYHERTYPLGTFMFWPTPDKTYSVHLWSTKAFQTFSAIDDVLTVPPEYEAAIMWNLAVEMAPEFEKDPSSIVVHRAASTLGTIKLLNAKPVPQIRTDVICRKYVSSRDLFPDVSTSQSGFPYTFPFVLR